MLNRRESVRAAGAHYQRGRRGRRLHAARMQRYRERKSTATAKFSERKVTHHSVTQGVTCVIELRAAHCGTKPKELINGSIPNRRCAFCARPLSSRFLRFERSPRQRRRPRQPTGPPRRT